RERQARRRVQPLGEDESEEARVRGVPIPAVGRLLEELAADEPHHDHADAETPVNTPTLHRGDSANTTTSGRQDSPMTVAGRRNAFVALQLKQLARAVSSIPPSPTWGPLAEEDGGNGPSRGFPRHYLLQSPSIQLHQLSANTTTTSATSQGDFFLRQNSATASGSAEGGLGATFDSSTTATSTTTAAAGVVAGGDERDGHQDKPFGFQHSTVQSYLVSQLEQLSQLLHSPHQVAGVKIGDAAATSLTSSTAADDREGGRKIGYDTTPNSSGTNSLQYSLSSASSPGPTSPFSASGTTTAVAAAAEAATARLLADSEYRVSVTRTATATGGEEVEADSTKVGVGGGIDSILVTNSSPPPPSAALSVPRGEVAAAAAAPLGAIGGGGGQPTQASRPPQSRACRRGAGGGGIEDSGRKVPSPISGGVGKKTAAYASPPPPGLRPGTRVSSAAAVREDGSSDGDGSGDGKVEGGTEEEEGGEREAPHLSSSSMWRAPRSTREVSAESTSRWRSGSLRAGAHRLTESFGRASLWRRMLEVESRTESAVMAGIVEENRGVLDQGIVLPCAPSDEEKVIYHKTGRCFLVSTGVFSVAALSAGMWLFTFAAPYFYWFAAPTAFIMGYLLLSYFGVAVWGKNFDPEDHNARILKARSDRYYPSVDVFMPVCREPTHLLDNTWKYVRALDYPNLTVHVLDDGAKEEVRQLAEMHGFNYIRRTNIPELKKAGNLRYAFARTSGEVLVIFDADFCPRPEFLRETTPYFRDQDVAILQTPQFFRHREEQTWVEKGAGVTQELFYRMVQVNRNKFDASICVGTCGVYRREALAPFGGTAAIGYSEDVHTGFNCVQLGYKVKYIPQVMAMGTCPDEPRAFFMQQYRWCMGSTTLLCNREFWGSSLTGMQKLCYLSGMFYYSATAVTIFTGPMPGMLLIWFKPEAVLWFNISFAVPSIIFGFVIMRFWAKQPYDLSCQRVKIIQSFSHLYALKDKLMNTSVPWIPTGGGASSRSSSQAYDSSVKLMLVWTMTYTLLTVGGAAWRYV
ncbi:unnamed protein product, partial [Pylaiella littoralis]